MAHLTVPIDLDAYEESTKEMERYAGVALETIKEQRIDMRRPRLDLNEGLGTVPGMIKVQKRRLTYLRQLFSIRQERPKRQIAMAGLGLGALLSFGVSAYTLEELAAMRTSVSGLQEDVNYSGTN